MSTHERIAREETVAGSSDRSFGLVFAGFFTLLLLLKLWSGWTTSGWVYLGLALAFAVAALTVPSVLAPMNRLWLKFGLLLHRIISPLVMGMLFYTVVTPIGLLMRALGKDLLRLKRDPAASSYWILREPPGPAPDTMKQQF
ncbi:MAG: SxtJ family membrane protein [Alphaproteobacteria bacterium]|nr:SxtJ family membrane protein [Alphaproteobacteria bacterium]